MTAVKTPYVEGVGKRKTSIARVRISKSTKSAIHVNSKTLDAYFPTEEMRTIVMHPLNEMAPEAKLDISVHVKGGGIHSQAEALAHGIARALVKHDAELKAPVKKAGMLTRDARIKERRKFGLKKARKSPQWSKR
ncbi:MAG: 30S ribosomal protein S9 [Patescibacteria group bacterium]